MADVVWKVALSNPCRPDLPAMRVDANVVDEPYYCALPESLCVRLGLTQIDVRTLATPWASPIDVPYVGPIELRFGQWIGYGGVLKAGDRICIGRIALSDLFANG